MKDERIILSFKGEFTAELLTSFLNILESQMVELKINNSKRKRVFNVLIECFQNLYHHITITNSNNEVLSTKKTALVIVKHNQGDFTVRTGNYIENVKIDELKRKLAIVNSLDSEGLKMLYQEKLANGPRTDNGTAGLGLIGIARKSKSKLDCEFIKIDEFFSFFSLKIVIE
tara:strand:- start:4324 stop:4839 length:516 start_codon:yes stop_codon:yes gene_type:complete